MIITVRLILLLIFLSHSALSQKYWIKTSPRNFYVTDFAEDSKGNIYVTGVKNGYSSTKPNGFGIYKSSDNGLTWAYLGLGDIISPVYTIFVLQDSIFLAGVGGKDSSVLKSTDYGKSWRKACKGLDTNWRTFPFVRRFVINSKKEIFGRTNGDIIKSNDFGETWKTIPVHSDTYKPDIICTSKDIIITCSDLGISIYNEKYDKENAIDVYQCSRGFCSFRGLAINNKDEVFVSGSAEGYTVYSDNYYNWYPIKRDNIPLGSEFIFSAGDYVYARDGYEDFKQKKYIEQFIKTNDYGKTWTDISYNLYDIEDSIGIERVYMSKRGFMFLGTGYKGVFRSVDPIMSKEEGFKSAFTISPNPASDYIEISGSSVILSEAKSRNGVETSVAHPVLIFDLLGMEITTPNLTPTLSEGEGVVRLDVSSLSPGVYFIRVGNELRKFVKM
jgi:hypothetical protein